MELLIAYDFCILSEQVKSLLNGHYSFNNATRTKQPKQ